MLAYSRAMWAELVLDLSAASLRRSLLRAAAYFELCGDLCVAPRLCAVRKPEQKGKVERAIRFLRDRFLAGRTIRDVERGNAELRVFLDTIANARPHPRWSERRVGEVLAEERQRLLALPDAMPPDGHAVSVDKTAFVYFDSNRYSVPSRAALKTVLLFADDTTASPRSARRARPRATTACALRSPALTCSSSAGSRPAATSAP